jgi:predicted adenine nucleotide alpha hydrolase (AANH) superfamily ATPase
MVEGHRVTGFFYNPNIHPVDEYEKRLAAASKVAHELGFELQKGPYNREAWFELVKGKEYAKEGGARCEVCFRMRLEKTYETLRRKNFDAFTTTLSVSPLKDAMRVNEIGRDIGGEKFILADFKKKNGFQRTMELSRELGIYHQDYCGCIYSLEEKLSRHPEEWLTRHPEERSDEGSLKKKG